MGIAEIFASIRLLWEIVKAGKELAEFIEKYRTEKWFQESAELFSKWKEAKTPDDKKKLVTDLGKLWSGL